MCLCLPEKTRILYSSLHPMDRRATPAHHCIFYEQRSSSSPQMTLAPLQTAQLFPFPLARSCRPAHSIAFEGWSGGAWEGDQGCFGCDEWSPRLRRLLLKAGGHPARGTQHPGEISFLYMLYFKCSRRSYRRAQRLRRQCDFLRLERCIRGITSCFDFFPDFVSNSL